MLGLTSFLINKFTCVNKSASPMSMTSSSTAGSPLLICSRITPPISFPIAGQLSTLSPVNVTAEPLILTPAIYGKASNFSASGALLVSDSLLKFTGERESTSASSTNLHFCGSAVGSPRILIS